MALCTQGFRLRLRATRDRRGHVDEERALAVHIERPLPAGASLTAELATLGPVRASTRERLARELRAIREWTCDIGVTVVVSCAVLPARVSVKHVLVLGHLSSALLATKRKAPAERVAADLVIGRVWVELRAPNFVDAASIVRWRDVAGVRAAAPKVVALIVGGGVATGRDADLVGVAVRRALTEQLGAVAVIVTARADRGGGDAAAADERDGSSDGGSVQHRVEVRACAHACVLDVAARAWRDLKPAPPVGPPSLRYLDAASGAERGAGG